jgi:predicted TIM-barrel fold metal-dependent hydrolase
MNDPITIDCHNHVGVELLMYLRGEFPYGQMLPTMIAEGQAAGVTHWIVFPMVSNLSLDISALREAKIADGGLEEVPYAFENRRLLQEIYTLFPHHAEVVFPFAMFDPMRQPVQQVATLQALRREFPFFGLKTQTTILQSYIKSLMEEGRVILELAEEWNMPLLIHSSVYPGDLWAQARDILDIAEATPRVHFCIAHSCRFDRTQLDRIAALPNAWFDCSAHIIHCQLAVADSPHVAPPERRFPSDYTRPEVVLRDLAEAYPDKLIWGSDSPYYSYVGSGLTLFSTYAAEGACLYSLPEEARHRVAFENTQRCFHLPLGGNE